jgi:hypothetical protein
LHLIAGGAPDDLSPLFKLATRLHESGLHSLGDAIAKAIATRDDDCYSGLSRIAFHAPASLEQLFELAKTSEKVTESIANAIKMQAKDQWTGLHMIARWAPNHLPTLFQQPEFSDSIIKAIELEDNWKKIECCHARVVFDDLLADVKIRYFQVQKNIDNLVLPEATVDKELKNKLDAELKTLRDSFSGLANKQNEKLQNNHINSKIIEVDKKLIEIETSIQSIKNVIGKIIIDLSADNKNPAMPNISKKDILKNVSFPKEIFKTGLSFVDALIAVVPARQKDRLANVKGLIQNSFLKPKFGVISNHFNDQSFRSSFCGS